MKKKIFTLAAAIAMVGILASGCMSSKSAGGSDTTSVKDTTKMTAPMADTSRKDTMMKKDTTHH